MIRGFRQRFFSPLSLFNRNYHDTQEFYMKNDTCFVVNDKDEIIDIGTKKTLNTSVKSDQANSGSGSHSTNSGLLVTSYKNESSTQSKVLLDDLLHKLNNIQPTVPDKVGISILENSGLRLDQDDPRLARLMTFGAQKYMTDLIKDCMTQHKLNAGQATGLLSTGSTQSTIPSSSTAPAVPPPASSQNESLKATSNDQTGANSGVSVLTNALQSPVKPGTNANNIQKDKKTSSSAGTQSNQMTLTIEDLTKALRERGINIAPPPYYK